VTWSFATANYSGQPYQWDSQISTDADKAAIRLAFAKWESVCNIDFVEVSDSSDVDVRLGWDAIDGPSNTVGQCYYQTLNNSIVDADIRFDTAESWTNSATGSGTYLYAVALHEIGHALGLDHYDGAPVIMNTFTGVDDLAQGDIDGVRTLYGYVTSAYYGTASNEKFDLHGRTSALTIRGGGGDDFLWSGTGGDTLYGNAGRDIVVGNSGADVIYGDDDASSPTGGNDQLLGNYGNDRIYGGGGNDYIHGEWDNDNLNGGSGADLIYGGFGSDILSGGDGDDILWGGTSSSLQGNWFGSAISLTRNGLTGATISEAWTIAGEVQDTDASNDNLSGGSGNDRLYGGAGTDVLNGGTGNDTMYGGTGNDTFVVAATGDKTIELAGQGTDTVQSYINWTLSDNVERLELLGTASLNGTGNALNNTLVGNAAANTLNGAAGDDYMVGGAGNDTYLVASAGDRTIEAAGGGTDTVRSYVTWTLAANVERLELLGTANLNGTGNALANTLVGNSGSNILNGGAGNDYMAGGAGNDTFFFNTALGASNIDTITDYNVAQDTVRLENGIFTALVGTGTLTAAQFVKNASGIATDANDRIIYETDTGKLFYDSNGSAAGGQVQFAKLAAGLALTASDFFIV
jgi:Ca2+-binding RTX toxin-like protein